MRDSEIKGLWEEIDRLRDKLHEVVNQTGFESPGAIQASKRLDKKMNEYYRLKNRSQ
jgi:hypothetical protein